MPDKKIKFLTIAGTRPEIIKLAEFIRLMRRQDHAFLYTGQHFSDLMSDIFFKQLNITPDYDIDAKTSDVKSLKASITKVLKELKPEYVIIYGDTYSSLAGALAARESGRKIIHIEAGIRDLDSTVPEEPVRIHIDSIADYMYAPTKLAETFLFYEGRVKNVFVTGNLIVDVCQKFVAQSHSTRPKGVPKKYALLTMHRPENVDDEEHLGMLVSHLKSLPFEVVFPIHPRTTKNLEKYGIGLPSNVISAEPMGYLEFLNLLNKSTIVMTDSGGVTEEAAILKKPCITMRHTTARWETILLNANILFGLDRKDSLADVVKTMLKRKMPDHPYGSNVAKKTAKHIIGLS